MTGCYERANSVQGLAKPSTMKTRYPRPAIVARRESVPSMGLFRYFPILALATIASNSGNAASK